MRERYQITITDYRGARHYTLSQVARRVLAAAGVVLLSIFLGGSLLIYLLSGEVNELMGEVAELKAQQQDIREQNNELLAQRDRMQQDVEAKAQALAEMGDELGNIEMMVGLRPEPEHTLYERLDTASQTAQEKHFMLTSVPSGYPVDEPRVTSGFGMRNHPVYDRTAMHGGVDFRARRGTPVYATADGLVEWASKHESSGLGNMVKLVHNYGFSSTYGHLDEVKVRVGDYVRQGDLIGLSGNTGVSSAPHLHYEIRYLHRRLDPKPFLEWSIEDYEVLFSREERVQWESLAEIVRRVTNGPERQWSQLAPALSAISN